MPHNQHHTIGSSTHYDRSSAFCDVRTAGSRSTSSRSTKNVPANYLVC